MPYWADSEFYENEAEPECSSCGRRHPKHTYCYGQEPWREDRREPECRACQTHHPATTRCFDSHRRPMTEDGAMDHEESLRLRQAQFEVTRLAAMGVTLVS